MVLGKAPLQRNVDLVADCLLIRNGSTIAIPEGTTTVVRASRVVIEGDATIVGAGSAGQAPPAWTSGGADCVFAHSNWIEAVRMSASHDEPVPGGNGGSFVLRYGRIEGGTAQLARLRFDVRGGMGALGRELRCGCSRPEHAAHVARSPRGPDGQSGTWSFLETTP